MHLATLKQGKALFLYDADSFNQTRGLNEVKSALFTSTYWHQLDQITGEAPGRGSSLFIQPDPESHQQWVLRHYLRGGMVAKISSNQYLWTGQERSRAFSEMRLNAHLYQCGLPVPRPIAAWVYRHWVSYEAALITQRIPGAQALADYVRDPTISSSTIETMLISVGRMIRRFHDHYLDHVDLNARNILIDAHQQPWLIDLDRCRLRRPGRWQQQNMARIERSLLKFNPNLCVTPLHQGYLADS